MSASFLEALGDTATQFLGSSVAVAFILTVFAIVRHVYLTTSDQEPTE